MKAREVLITIYQGNYKRLDDGVYEVINDNCPQCGWELPVDGEPSPGAPDEPSWCLGELWRSSDKGIGNYFAVYQCPDCGLTYATHLN